MATRNTINRITSRIDELAERHTPSRGPIMIVVRDEAECRARLREIEAAGGLAARQVLFHLHRRAALVSAAQDVAAGQDAEQERMPARRAVDSSAS
jgi:hypothetical protein